MSTSKRANLQTLVDKGLISPGAQAEFYHNRTLYDYKAGAAQFKYTTTNNEQLTGKDPSSFIKMVVKQTLTSVSGSNEMLINGKSMHQWKEVAKDDGFATSSLPSSSSSCSNTITSSTETPNNTNYEGMDEDDFQNRDAESTKPKDTQTTHTLRSLEDLEHSFSQMGIGLQTETNTNKITHQTPTKTSQITTPQSFTTSPQSLTTITPDLSTNITPQSPTTLQSPKIPPSSISASEAERSNLIPYYQAPRANLLQQASIEGGFAWEQYITDHYLGGAGNVVSPADTSDPVEVQNEKSIMALRETPSGKYIVQACLLPPQSMWRSLPKSLVQFSRSYPDFLQITTRNNRREIVILDAKSTTQAKFSQQVQVAFYFLLLKNIIAEHNIADLEVSNMGGIWLKGKKDVDYFDILPVSLILKSFLYGSKETDLRALLSVPKQLADWHMLPICEGCDFFDVCHTQSEHDNTLSQVAYLGKPTRAMLLNFRETFATSIPDIPPPTSSSPSATSLVGTEIEDLHKLLNHFQVAKIEKFEDQLARMNGTTLANLKIAAPRIKASHDKQVMATGSVNVDFPTVQEDVSIYISFISSPETNSHYAWAVQINDEKRGNEFTCGEDIGTLVMLLSNAFQVVNEYNLNAKSLLECKSLQCYIFDSYEQSLLVKTLLNLVLSADNNNNGHEGKSVSGLVIVLLAFLHTSDWLGFGGGTSLPGSTSTSTKTPSSSSHAKAKPKPSPTSLNDPTRKLDFSETSATSPRSSLPHSDASATTNPDASIDSATGSSTTGTSVTSTTAASPATPARDAFTIADSPTTPKSPNVTGTTSPLPLQSKATPPPIKPTSPTSQDTPLTSSPAYTSTPSSSTSPSTPPSPSTPLKKEMWRNSMSCSPTIVVQSLVATMLAIPHFPVYDINSCVKYILQELPEHPIDSESIYKEWKTTRKIGSKVEEMLRQRLISLCKIVNALRTPEFIGTKHKYPRKFALRPRIQLSNPLVSRMLFTAEYELASSCTKIRNERSQPLAVRIQQGKVIKLSVYASDISVIIPKRSTSATYDSFSVAATLDEVYGKIPQPDFANEFSWLVTQNTLEGENAVYRFDDATYQDGIPPDLAQHLGLARVESAAPNPHNTGFIFQLRIKLRKKSTLLPSLQDPHAKVEIVLHERFLVDLTFPTIHQHALDMDQLCKEGHTPLLLRLISSPEQWNSSVPEEEFGVKFQNEAARIIKEFADMGLELHPSQAALWNQLVSNRLQLVWGPPGTGKTHFLALSILILLETHRALSIPYTIGVTAFTHIALEHVLAKLCSLQRIAKRNFGIIKLGPVMTKEGLEANISSKEPNKGTLPAQCVVGGTVWRLRRAFGPHGDVLDCLVIDEATQLPVLDASIATQFINESRGRLILAGDHKQLGPIRIGEYPVNNDGTSIQLHKSVFVCLKKSLSYSAVLKGKHLGVLLENMRMNEDLCSFAAEFVYTPDYKPYQQAITQPNPRAPTTTTTSSSTPPARSLANLVSRILSDDRSMVVVLLPASAKLSTQSWEAQLTALLALELFYQSGLPMDADGFAEFWRKQLFVVTPQHVQRLATRRALEQAGFTPEHLFVDTVEKMQGQEAETVIVSYGSYQWANSSSEFVFNRNRLNVCTSRARSRCIVLLLEDLLSPSPTVLDNPATKKAFYYLVSLVNFAKVFHLQDFI